MLRIHPILNKAIVIGKANKDTLLFLKKDHIRSVILWFTTIRAICALHTLFQVDHLSSQFSCAAIQMHSTQCGRQCGGQNAVQTIAIDIIREDFLFHYNHSDKRSKYQVGGEGSRQTIIAVEGSA